MPTTYTARTSVTPTTYTGRASISWFQSYTWATAPDIWSAVSDTWATYGIISSWTAYTGRVTI